MHEYGIYNMFLIDFFKHFYFTDDIQCHELYSAVQKSETAKTSLSHSLLITNNNKKILSKGYTKITPSIPRFGDIIRFLRFSFVLHLLQPLTFIHSKLL